ncbi:hypothetical protein CQ060_18185 [Ochrobactrum sp. MYb237]|nr:hypothetical protein [Ochrobactrum sp. MYb237]
MAHHLQKLPTVTYETTTIQIRAVPIKQNPLSRSLLTFPRYPTQNHFAVLLEKLQISLKNRIFCELLNLFFTNSLNFSSKPYSNSRELPRDGLLGRRVQADKNMRCSLAGLQRM